MKKKKSFTLIIALFVIALLLVSCGGNETDPGTETKADTETKAPEEIKSDGTIKVTNEKGKEVKSVLDSGDGKTL